jgi:hypothetical protein
MKGEYNSISDAVRKYPALKQTVTLAKIFSIKLVRHYAKFTKRGKVCQHLWLAHSDFDKKDEWQRNQDLLNWLRNCKELQKNTPVINAMEASVLKEKILPSEEDMYLKN